MNDHSNFSDTNNNIDIISRCIKLMILYALINSKKSDPSDIDYCSFRTTQAQKLRDYDHRHLTAESFGPGVIAIGFYSPEWRRAARKVLAAIIGTDGAVILVNPSEAQIAETNDRMSQSMVEFEQPAIRGQRTVSMHSISVQESQTRTIILTCPTATNVKKARAVAERARDLDRRGWRVLILCDDALQICNDNRANVDQALQAGEITPWLLCKICQQRSTKRSIYSGRFLSKITPARLKRSWRPGSSEDVLKIHLEEAICARMSSLDRWENILTSMREILGAEHK